MTVRLPRRLAAAVSLAIALAIGGVAALAPVAVDAAAPGLTISGAATYDVLPDEGRVAVSAVLTATNHLKDTLTKHLMFRTALLTVLPGTSGFKITAATGKPKVSVASRTATYTNLKIDLGANLNAGKTTTLTLTFNLKDPGGAPDRPVRISPSLVSFAAWAVAAPQSPGASVAVRLPSGYNATIGRGPLDGPVPDATGHDTWSSGALASPLTFVADVVADRPTDYAETSLSVPMASGSASVVVRSWPDDPKWRDRIAALVQRALPILEREIGVPWPIRGPLAIHEAVARSTGGFAGVFDPASGQIDIAYAAPDGVVVHELAHAWFNGSLVADRWAAEGFAAYYAELAAQELGIDPSSPAPPTAPGDWAIPLNAWGPAGSAPAATDAWAATASLDLARTIAQRAGPAAMQSVWAAAAGGIGAYQPSPAGNEPALGPPDWRGLLDLLEEHTDTSFSDLWLTRVARPADVATLADRAATRGWYVRSVGLAGPWRLPPVIRTAMRAWRFDLARQLLGAADGVMSQRTKLDSAAAAAGLALPDRLRVVFEGESRLAAAAAEATAEQSVVDAIAAARAAEPTEHGVGQRLIIGVGLLGSDPHGRVAAAASALASGDLKTAYAAALDAEGTWQSAAALGRSRIVSVALLLIALVLLAGLVRQRRGRSTGAPGAPAAQESHAAPEVPGG